MTMQNTAVPKGTRDFLPEETAKREYIFNSIKSVFKTYGYVPIETPAMENLSTLTGKYGNEGDKLLFKILNSGDYLKKVDESELKKDNYANLIKYIADKGLRYDLTVPFARYVVKNQNDLSFPFKRYQIQPVWRADKPQKGRYREFYQCDVDVIGANQMTNEYELVCIINDVFQKLNLNACLKLNNRKILAGLFESMGVQDKFIEITTAIDKIDKIGIDKLKIELEHIGLDNNNINTISEIISLNDSNENVLKHLADLLKDSEIGMQGVEEVQEIMQFTKNDSLFIDIKIDLSLARGLDYYTGAIFEVVAKDFKIGSICGGGRYDNLTEMFGLKNISGVGISFGADRVYDVMSNLKLFPKEIESSTKVLFVNFGGKELKYSLELAKILRKNNINTEVYPDTVKIKKQMQYANKKNIAYVVLIGENELKNKSATVKNMLTGEQNTVTEQNLIKYINNEV